MSHAPVAGHVLSAPDQATAAALLLAHEALIAAEDAGAIAQSFAQMASWIRAADDSDGCHARWIAVERAFSALDLGTWEGRPDGLAALAEALASVDFYRQTDLSVEARFELLTRVRRMLPRGEKLAAALVDLERAELASMTAGGEDPVWALSVCDQAIGPGEEMAAALGPLRFAGALMSRAQILARAKRYDEALATARRAEKTFVELGARQATANVQRLFGEIWAVRGNWPNAQMFLGEAIQIYKETRDAVGEALSLLARARVWPAQRAHRMVEDCNEVVRLCEGARLRAVQGQAMLTRGFAQERAAEFVLAARDYRAAATFLEESPERYELALALLSIAAMTARVRGPAEEIAGYVARAESAVRGIHHERLAARAHLRICKVLQDLPSPDKPGVARNAERALHLSAASGDTELGDAARSFLAYAGVSAPRLN